MSRLKRVVIAGGTGFLGLSLARSLTERGIDVLLISRTNSAGSSPWSHAVWDGRTPGDWCQHLNDADVLVNLAGRTVDCSKTPDHCDQILRSRVESTRVLGQALRKIEKPPSVWVQMSTAHRYGDSPDVVCDEDSAFGYGLAPFVGEAWENAYIESVLPQMRQVILRTSFVLGTSGGALPRLATLTRWGLGGKIASGQQGMSWIHEHDLNRIFHRAMEDESMRGAYIASAPNPVSNRDFMRALRKVLGRPIGLPAMEWMVKLGAPLVMRTDPELALYGRYCVSKRLREEGFEFEYPTLEGALERCFRSA